jgi:hypothetical protein
LVNALHITNEIVSHIPLLLVRLISIFGPRELLTEELGRWTAGDWSMGRIVSGTVDIRLTE